MKILVDLENVHAKGALGAEFLNKTDDVILFYSQAAPNMETHYLNLMAENCGKLSAIKLKTARKNALDFYIASYIGALLGSGYDGEIAIVSTDNGFLSIKEYWEQISDAKHEVICAGNIFSALAMSKADDGRSIRMQEGQKVKDIGNFMAAYDERHSIRGRITAAFKGTEFESATGDIVQLIGDENMRPADIYRQILHDFGRAKGLRLYHILKEAV